MGPDGHVASLFPGKPEVEERSRLVVGVPLAGMEPQVPRISLTLPAINAAREAILLITGENKAATVARVFGPGAGRARCRPRMVELALRRADRAPRRGRGVAAVSDRFIGLDVGGTKIASRDAVRRRAVRERARARPRSTTATR